jgi:hypothetical protein
MPVGSSSPILRSGNPGGAPVRGVADRVELGPEAGHAMVAPVELVA